jgi:hypothetical protein
MDYSGIEESNLDTNLVERQLQLWNTRRLAARKKAQEESEHPFRFLTIARDKGSLGAEVAEELSRSLGWHVFDHEIVSYIARNSHVREDLVRQLDEKSQGLIQDAIARLLNPGLPRDAWRRDHRGTRCQLCVERRPSRAERAHNLLP